MKNKSLRTLFARILLVLQLTQLLTPHVLLNSAPAAQTSPAHTLSLGLPSRKVFKEITECWEGLRPPAFIKNTANVSAGSSFEATVRLVGGQQKTLSLNRKNKAVAEAIQFLNNLASPGKALEKMNCSKRMMADMQMFHEKGLFKSFNRTILSLGQALQITQFYQGADSQKEAEERRDFITGLLRTPDAARAIGVRIRCFSKYENQFLRQTMTLRNESLEQKIKTLEPSRLFGPLRNSPAFIRWHSRLVENPFYETLKNAYLLFAAYVAINLFARSFARKLPGMAKDYALAGGPLATLQSVASSVADEFTIPTEKSATPGREVKIALSETEKNNIMRDIAFALAEKAKESSPGARYDLMYHMAGLFFGSKTREGVFKDSAQHFAKNLPAAAGSLIIGPLQGISFLLMIAKKFGGKELKHRQQTSKQSQKPLVGAMERTCLAFCKNEIALPKLLRPLKVFKFLGDSLSAETWEGGIDLFSTFPDLLADTATDLIDRVTKANKAKDLFWDGDPATAKTTAALKDLFDFLNPLRSMLDHGADNRATVEGLLSTVGASNPTAANNLVEGLTGNSLYQNPDTQTELDVASTAAKAQHIPLYGRWQNVTLNPLHWIFGRRATNIFLGNIPYIGWARLLTGNTSAYWKESKMFSSLVVNGLEAAANNCGVDYKKELGSFTAKDGVAYTLSLAPGAMEILSGINTVFGKKELPTCALFCVSTTGADGVKKFLTHEELSENGDLLKEMTTHLQTNADRFIKETLAPYSLLNSPAMAAIKLKKAARDTLAQELKTESNAAKKQELQDKLNTCNAELTALKNAIPNDFKAVAKTIKKKQIISRFIEGYIGYICLGLALVYTLGNLKNQEKMLVTETLDSHMFSSLKPAVALSEMVRQITHVLSKHSTTIQLPQSLKTKLTMLVASATPNCKNFAKLAQNKMFLKATKPLLFGDYGTLRCAYKLTALPDVKRWLSVCATLMAEVDSYLAIARLVAEHKDAPNYFYPITFLNQEAPRAELSGFWLPLIGAYKSIPNDLVIGDPAHILITGLNGGGKSFALKGLLFTILMSHAFGYGPVKRGAMTFFNKIITHLSTTDNAAEGESCWIAEAKSMGNAIHAMQAPHAHGDRILYIGDELGSGTASAASIQAVASLMDIALEQPHVASIITTHLRPLTELEYLTNGRIHNYRVGGTVSDTGVIQRKFQLERGRANINIAALIFNQQLEHGEQKTLAPGATPAPVAAAAA